MAANEEPQAEGIKALQRLGQEARERLGMTYMDLAWELEFSAPSEPHRILTKNTYWPDPELFHKLCDVLELDHLEVLRQAGYLRDEEREEHEGEKGQAA